jgi:hypothetical protein
MRTLLKHRSLQVLFLVVGYLAASSYLPSVVHQALYTISLFIKDLLLWMLPITVGLFIAHAISSFEKRAPLFILTLFLFEAFSNSLSVWYGYGCGQVAAHYFPVIESHALNDSFSPLWRLALQKPLWWTADKGTFAGIVLGILASFKLDFLKNLLARGKHLAERVLTRVFARLIPLFVLGFVARMVQTNLLQQMFAEYATLLLWLVLFLVIYIVFLFVAGSGKACWKNMKNLGTAGGIAFSSGCSLSTMPWTIEGTAKNLQNPDLAKAVIPATTNIQQIGDCIANTFLCFLIYRHFNGHAPDLAVWLPFSLVFVLARFATAAVLGGAIFIMLPIYEAYLGFNAEMIAMILAFNVILDPLITSANVVANGALCRIFEKLWLKLLKRSKTSSFEVR